jgi:hypothetical protein
LPSSVDEPGDYQIVASWSLTSPSGSLVERTGEVRLRLVNYVLNDAYKDKPAGRFYVEACPGAELDVTGMEQVPLGMTTADARDSADFLELDASARFQGPGLGEMSLVPKSGFDWLVIGPKNAPELLVFVGYPEHPTPPAQRRAVGSGDTRHWRHGFRRAVRRFWRDNAGQYRPLEEGPDSLRAALKQYLNHHVDRSAPVCDEAGLETHLASNLPRSRPAERTLRAVDAFAALSSRRSGLTYQEAQEVFAAMVGNDNPVVFHQVLRAWTEAGLVEVLRHAVSSRLTILARRPRLVMVRRGPDVEATVVGLLSSVRRAQLEAGVKALGLEKQFAELLPGNPWQPSALRLRATPDTIEELRRRADLAPSEWLLWPSLGNVPAEFDARTAMNALRRSSPPSAYRPQAAWDWEAVTFRRGLPAPAKGVQLERRLHKDFSALYVVLEDGNPKLWSDLRSWAVLSAYTLAGTHPFQMTTPGMLECEGRTPVHLPLALARLCLLVGEALPGPVLSGNATNTLKYVYPFGPRLYRLVEKVLPGEWIRTKT